MESKNEFEKNDIKNNTCYYFNVLMAAMDIDSWNILLDEKLYKNILIYDIWHKAFMGLKSLGIWFNKIEWFFKIYDGIKYLILFGHNWYDETCDKIRYLICKKSGITDRNNH